jgi:hypothetical protein
MLDQSQGMKLDRSAVDRKRSRLFRLVVKHDLAIMITLIWCLEPRSSAVAKSKE